MEKQSFYMYLKKISPVNSKGIHPHPTMSEAVMEAVADAYGEVIHL